MPIVSLITNGAPSTWDRITIACQACGLTVVLVSPADVASLVSANLVCAIVDLPPETAAECLRTLKKARVAVPALFVTDDAAALTQVNPQDWLDVLTHPVDMRALLGWIECICATRLALERRRAA